MLKTCGPGWIPMKVTSVEKLLAIPHNGNLSNGLMFDDVTYTDRAPLDQDYAKTPGTLGTSLRSRSDERRWRSPSVSFARR